MNRFETYIRERHQKVHDARSDIEGRLATRINDGESIAPEVASIAAATATTGWWDRVIIAIDYGGVDPIEALWSAREAAHHVLTDQATPRPSCPFALGFAIAQVEAARGFYHDTAHLDALIARTCTDVNGDGRAS